MGDQMVDSLLCPNQCRDFGIEIDTRPKLYCDDASAQTMRIPHLDLVIPIHHHGPLPYFNVRRPSSDELLHCEIIDLTSMDDWDPYNMTPIDQHLTQQVWKVSTLPHSVPAEVRAFHEYDAISNILLSYNLVNQLRTTISVDIDDRTCSVMATRKRDTLSPEELARLWKIGIHTANRTLKATTHQCLRTAGNITKRFKTDRAHMRYKRLSTKYGQFYVDTLFAKVKSIRGYTCGNLYTNRLGFKKFYPMVSNNSVECASTLKTMIELVGIPPALHSDNAPEFLRGEFKRKCRHFDIRQTSTEANSPWQNRAEGAIREVKAYAHSILESQNVPIRLWCFAYEYAADILSLTATGLYQLGGWTPYEHVMQYTPDISEYVVFQFYQWCYYWDEDQKEKKIGRWLGVAHEIGQSMCYWILTATASYIARSTVIPIPDEDLQSDSLKERMNNFDCSIKDIIGNHDHAIVNSEVLNNDDVYCDALFLPPEESATLNPWDDTFAKLEDFEENENTLKVLDEYLGANVCLPGNDGDEVLCKVKGRKRDTNGIPIGERNNNPILDSRIFQVEFPDGHIEEYSTNVIAEAILSQADEDGNNYGILEEIVEHRRRDCAVPMSEGYTLVGTNRKPVITTKGWDLKVRWSDGSYDWLPMSQLKQSNPLQVAEYAVAHKIEKEPAFNWWVPKILRKRNRIINRIESRCRKNHMNFGIRVPKGVSFVIF
jgi:hypothetical protein